MKIVAKQLLVASCVFGLFVTGAQAEGPTFSFVVGAVNGVPVVPPASKLVVDPGDVLEALILLRDWSDPTGQELRGYEGVIDFDGYQSGAAGDVFPLGFAGTTDLNGHCTAGGDLGESNPSTFVNEAREDPDFVFLGLPSVVSATDTLSCDYRLTAALTDPAVAPLSVPGEGFYCGTIFLAVSADAEGVFTLGFKEDACLLRDENSEPITIAAFEDLILSLDFAPMASVPPDGAIDAGMPSDLNDCGDVFGWDEIAVEFTADASSVTASDFTITVDPADTTAPTIAGISTAGNVATLTLDMIIPLEHWTVVTYDPTGWSTQIGYLPADANGDGTSGTVDILDLIDFLNIGVPDLPLWGGDLDRTGAINSADILTLIDLLNGAGPCWDPWLGATLP